MKVICLHCSFLLFLVAFYAHGGVPEDYKGKPFQDSTYSAGPQSIPGRLQATRYDLGGEGIAYHDADAINHGSGELNYKPEQCEAGVPAYV